MRWPRSKGGSIRLLIASKIANRLGFKLQNTATNSNAATEGCDIIASPKRIEQIHFVLRIQ